MRFFVTLALVLVPAVHAGAQAARTTPAARLKFTISRETTYFTEPLTEDGFIDYAAALNRHLSRDVSRANNANVLFWEALGPSPEDEPVPDRYFQLMDMRKPAADGQYFVEFQEFAAEQHPDQLDREALDQQLQAALERPWKSSEFPTVSAWIDRNQKPLQLVAAGSQRTKYFSPLVYAEGMEQHGLVGVLLPGVSSIRDFSRCLSARAMRHLGEGRRDAARLDLITCHRLGLVLSKSSTLIEKLVGIAITNMGVQASVKALAAEGWSHQDLQEFQRQLTSLPDRAPLADAIDLSERCMYLDSTLLLARGRIDQIVQGGDPSYLEKLLQKLVNWSIDWDVPLRMGNSVYDRMATAMRQPDYAQRIKASADLEEELFEAEKASPTQIMAELLTSGSPGEAAGALMGKVLNGLLLPAVAQSILAEDRVRQDRQLLLVAVALEIYRLDHKQYPDTLQSLAPRYLPQIPPDLFTGQPLTYRHAPDSYILYSWGPNQEDDEGVTAEPLGEEDDRSIRMRWQS